MNSVRCFGDSALAVDLVATAKVSGHPTELVQKHKS